MNLFGITALVASMALNLEPGETNPSTPTLADIEKELHRLRESKMLLVLMAQDVGMAIPRSCCAHSGNLPCVSCSADWLVARVRPASRSVGPRTSASGSRG